MLSGGRWLSAVVRESLSRSSRAPDLHYSSLSMWWDAEDEVDIAGARTETVHLQTLPAKKRDYIASPSVMVSLRFFFLRVSSVINRSLTLQRCIECGRPPFPIIHGSERRVPMDGFIINMRWVNIYRQRRLSCSLFIRSVQEFKDYSWGYNVPINPHYHLKGCIWMPSILVEHALFFM